MKQYLTKFSTRAEYTAALENLDFPNVTYLSEDDEMVFSQVKPEPETDWSKEYLTFLALEDGTFNFTRNAINYSLDDGQTWTALPTNTSTQTVTAGSKIMFKGNASITSYGIGTFSSTGNYEAMGNPYSLRYDDDFDGVLESGTNEFKNLFSGSTGLISAEHLALPAETLAQGCYATMFYGCTSLTTAPELPATTLVVDCYGDMFNGCTSLTAAPALPAATLAANCYYGMFYGCTSLNYVKMLATDVSPIDCLLRWLSGVSSSGTFVKHPNANLPSGASGIPKGWTVETATA